MHLIQDNESDLEGLTLNKIKCPLFYKILASLSNMYIWLYINKINFPTT